MAQINGTPASTLIPYMVCSSDLTTENCWGSMATPTVPATYTSGAAAVMIPADPTLPTPVDAFSAPTSPVFSVGATSHDCNSNVDGLVEKWGEAVTAGGGVVEIDPTVTPYCADFGYYVFPAWSGPGYILTRVKNAPTIFVNNRRVQPSDWPNNVARIIQNGPNTQIAGTDPRTFPGCYAGSRYWWQGQLSNGLGGWAMYQCNNGTKKAITSIPSSGALTITVPSHGIPNTAVVHISGVTGPGAPTLNDDWTVTVVDANTITLNPVHYAQSTTATGTSSCPATCISANAYTLLSYTPVTAKPTTCTFGNWYHIDASTAGPTEYQRTYYCQNTNNEAIPLKLDPNAVSFGNTTGAPIDLTAHTPSHIAFDGISLEPLYFKADQQLLQWVPGASRAPTGTFYNMFWMVANGSDHIYFDHILGDIADPFTGSTPTAIRAGYYFYLGGGSNIHIGGSYNSGMQVFSGLSSLVEQESSHVYFIKADKLDIENNFFSGATIGVFSPEDQNTMNLVGDITIKNNTIDIPDKYWVSTSPLVLMGVAFSARHQIELKSVQRMLVEGNFLLNGFVFINNAAGICLCARSNLQQGQAHGSTATLYAQSNGYGGYIATDIHAGDVIAFIYPNGTCSQSNYNKFYRVAAPVSPILFTLTTSTGCDSTLSSYIIRVLGSSGFTKDVTIRNNSFINTSSGIEILGQNSYAGPSVSGTVSSIAQRISIYNNLFYGTDGSRVGPGSQWFTNPASAPSGNIFQLQFGIQDVQIIHNTAIKRYDVTQNAFFNYPITAYQAWPPTPEPAPAGISSGFKLLNNIGEYLNFGRDFMEDGQSGTFGQAMLNANFVGVSPPWYYGQNTILRIQGSAGYPCNTAYDPTVPPRGPYPPGTLWFNGLWDGPGPTPPGGCPNGAPFPFFNTAQGNYRIQPTSIYVSGGSSPATDNTTVGVDPDVMEAAQGNVSNVRVFNIGTTTATVGFFAPNAAGCPVDWSSNNFSTYTRVSNAGGDRVQSVPLTGLTSGTIYQYRVDCTVMQPTGVFSTR